MTTLLPTRTQTKAVAAVLLAFGLVAGSVAPSSAGPTWPQNQGFANEAPSTTTGFHRHFWRGSQLSKAPAHDVETVALANEAEAIEAYCVDRFKSYDPSTGTYLGYDGNEHACP